MSEHYDDLETRSADQRESDLFGQLPAALAHAIEKAPGWAKHLDGVEVSSITSRDALAGLPVLRKGELKDAQAAEPPFGGFVAAEPGKMGRVFMSGSARKRLTLCDWSIHFWRRAAASMMAL